jgi:CubicO group peptidase (beta-lactamase class C family)
VRTLSATIVGVLFLFLPSSTHAQVSGTYGPKLQQVVHAYHEAGLFQGSVLVAMDGEVVYRDALGLANLEWGVANTPETRFAIASLGKAFTAALILKLRDERRLSLKDTIHDHLSSYPEDVGQSVTIAQLLGHTAGIPWPQDNWEPEQFTRRYELGELVELVAVQELLFEPGTEFRYCNSCYHLLAAIVVKITGNPFEDELRRRILQPLGMESTGIAYADAIIKWRASGYERLADGRVVNALQQDQSYAVGAGGMYSTVDDLYKWHRALDGNELLSDESKALMFEPGLNNSGYGWSVGAYRRKDVDELRKLVVGFGGTYGFASGMARLLDDGYFIVFLGNLRQVPQNRLMNDLWNTILGFDVDPVEPE